MMTDNSLIQDISTELNLNVDTINIWTETVLGDDIYFFPIRHHSPVSAFYLARAIEEQKPEIIFIEGPHECNHLIKHIMDPKTKPPVAIFSSFRDDANILGLAGIESSSEDIPPRFSAWYPLMEYSPEYIAITKAKERKIDAVFIDLPHFAEKQSKNRVEGFDVAEINQDSYILQSEFYKKMSQSAGYRSWDEAWDTLFEFREFINVEHYRRELAFFCAAARTTTPQKQLECDGTLARERFMHKQIHDILNKKNIDAKKVMVVCGGFHIFYDRKDTAKVNEVPEGTLYTTVVPWSFYRISDVSGYAAGNRAPAWYLKYWKILGSKKDTAALPVDHIVSVMQRARKKSESFSSADSIASSQTSLMLARLRGRQVPVLDDIHDALITCCCKGKVEDVGSSLLAAFAEENIGSTIGKVTSKVGLLPIVENFYEMIKDLELSDILGKEKKLKISLDKRNETDRGKSAFLHRLIYLQVEIGREKHVKRAGTIFREEWELIWSPSIEETLIEKSLYGDTIEIAVIALLKENIYDHKKDSGKVTADIISALQMDLEDISGDTGNLCEYAIDNDDSFFSLSKACANLLYLEKHFEFINTENIKIKDLIVRCYNKVCFSIQGITAVPGDQIDEVIEGIKIISSLLFRNDPICEFIDQDLFIEQILSAVSLCEVPVLKGVFTGLLTELKIIEQDELSHTIHGYCLSHPDEMIEAGDYISGLMKICRTSILFGSKTLMNSIDELLKTADYDSFLIMLPKLRASFESLLEGQRKSVCSIVGQIYGLEETEILSVLTVPLENTKEIIRIDSEAQSIIQKWEHCIF